MSAHLPPDIMLQRSLQAGAVGLSCIGRTPARLPLCAKVHQNPWPPAGLHRDYRQDMLIKISFIFKLMIEIVGIGGRQAPWAGLFIRAG